MKKILIASAVAALSCAIPALAGGPLGASAGARGSAGVGVGAAGVGANLNAGANVGASAGSHGPSATATENSNGSFAADREFGQDRARERRSEQGNAHERATTAPDKKRARHKPETPRAGVSASGGASTEAGARTQ